MLNLANHLLIANVPMADGMFVQGVVYIYRHDAEGAQGLLLNQPLGQSKLKDIFKHLKIEPKDEEIAEQTVLAGGPVKPDHGFVLHSPVGQWHQSIAVTGEIALTSSKDVLFAMAQQTGPQNAVVALGHAGWSAGQLEKELMDNAWLVAPASWEILFGASPEQRWTKALRLLGVHNIAQLPSYAGHA